MGRPHPRTPRTEGIAMAVAEVMLIVTVIVSPLAIEGQSATHSEYTREYPQMGIYQCTEQAEQIMAQHGINHTVVAVCVPANKHEPK